MTERTIVTPPGSQSDAGLAVGYTEQPGPHGTKVTVEQLWPNGKAEPVYVGDEGDALRLAEALREVAGDD